MATNAAGTTTATPRRGRRWLLALTTIVVLALIGTIWFVFFRPAPSDEPVAGEVMTLEPVQLNLSGGHYLRVGLALQLVEDAEVDGSKALDATISTFSGLPLAKVSTPVQREVLRTQLQERLDAIYEGDVMSVYFTDFVTQ